MTREWRRRRCGRCGRAGTRGRQVRRRSVASAPPLSVGIASMAAAANAPTSFLMRERLLAEQQSCNHGGLPVPRAKQHSSRRTSHCRVQAKARAAPNPEVSWPLLDVWTGPDRPYPGASDAAGGVDARRWRIVSSNPAMSAASTPPPSATIQTFEPSLAGVAAQAGQKTSRRGRPAARPRPRPEASSARHRLRGGA